MQDQFIRYRHINWRWKHKNVVPRDAHYTHSALSHIPVCGCIFNRGAVLLIALLTLLDSPAAHSMTSSPWQPLEGQAERSTVVHQALPQLQTWWKSSINHRQIAATSTEYDHTMSHHARTVLQKYCTMTPHETNCKKIIYIANGAVTEGIWFWAVPQWIVSILHAQLH